MRSASPLPASKRQKVAQSGHAPSKPNGLGFLVDENARAGKHLKAELTNGISGSRSSRKQQARTIVPPEASTEIDGLNGHKASAKGSRDAKRLANGNFKAATKKPAAVIDISSAEESSDIDLDEDDDEESGDEVETEDVDGKLALAGSDGANGHIRNKSGKPDASKNTNDEVDAAEEPAFGELLLARNDDQIDVEESLGAKGNGQLVPFSGEQSLDGISSATLGTVLTQALKTNDKERLETCFLVSDPERIRATIQRLSSQHVATLLQRISERIYARPGRTGSLFVWIQWSLVVHGGYLANHPEVMQKLKSLSRVVRERARGLQPLLHLKGKIDMLSGQLDLRRSIQQSAALRNAEDQDNEEGVVYIEGQDDNWSDDEEGTTAGQKRLLQSSFRSRKADDSDSEDDDGTHAVSNGVVNGVDEDSDDEDVDEDEDSEGLLDIEAEESSDEGSGDSDDAIDSDAESSLGEDDSDEDGSDQEVVKQPKLSTLNRRR